MMNEVIKNIFERRSVRKYKSEQVDREILEQILAAGYASPNAGNRQQLRVVVSQDVEINDHVGKAHNILLHKFNRFGAGVTLEASDFADPALVSAFHNAPTVLMLFGPKNFYFTDADGYIFAENICLAARSLGVGSCIVGEVLNAFSDEYGKALIEKWGIPDTHRSVVFVTLGYSAEDDKTVSKNKYADPLWVCIQGRIPMDFMDVVAKRTTVRKFAQRPVEDDKLQKILEAGRWAPTAVNGQPQRILVLNTPENLEKVREFCSFGYDQKYVDPAKESDDSEHGKINFYYGAPLVLFVSYDKDACWTHPQSGEQSGPTDATIVATHMMLEAASIDLGTVWISYFDEQKARELLKLPDSWQPICMLYIGYPAEDFIPNADLSLNRKPLSDTCFLNEVPTMQH